ncbi:MXAN_6577-like cysteine-rich protein [Myxococcaceae bacterium GXIMD 01537]
MSRQAARGGSTPRLRLAVAMAALGWVLSGCPDEGVVCSEGLTQCNLDCVDLTSESDNCGACGVACGQSQVCVDSACQCREGSTACNGQCVVTASDPLNCGACGQPCGAGQVCESGVCKVTCSPGLTRCGDSCVDLQDDAGNCGACGAACTDARACRSGVCTYAVVAACFNTGQVVGLQPTQTGDVLKGPNAAVGANIQTVSHLQDVLLALDAAPLLRQATLASYSPLPGDVAVGHSPNQLLVSDPYVYVINSTDNTLGVLQRTATPGPVTGGTRFPNGLGLQPVSGAAVNFGDNTNPFAMARVGNELFVTLTGNLGAGVLAPGGKLARVSLSDPARPVRLDPALPLPDGAALRPFAGESPFPTPAGITVFNGSLYIALNSMTAAFNVGGPGLLAKVNPRNVQVEGTVLLDKEGCAGAVCVPEEVDCLNPGWVAPVGGQLLVSCAGKAVYDASFNLTAVQKSALVLLSAEDKVLDVYPVVCPAGDAACALPSAGRFAVVGNRVYVADNNAGRVLVVEVANNTLREIRGAGSASALLACPRDSGPSLVGDVVAIE